MQAATTLIHRGFDNVFVLSTGIVGFARSFSAFVEGDVHALPPVAGSPPAAAPSTRRRRADGAGGGSVNGSTNGSMYNGSTNSGPGSTHGGRTVGSNGFLSTANTSSRNANVAALSNSARLHGAPSARANNSGGGGGGGGDGSNFSTNGDRDFAPRGSFGEGGRGGAPAMSSARSSYGDSEASYGTGRGMLLREACGSDVSGRRSERLGGSFSGVEGGGARGGGRGSLANAAFAASVARRRSLGVGGKSGGERGDMSRGSAATVADSVISRATSRRGRW